MIAELGIGLNHAIRPSGHVMLDEKAGGTAHIAIGRNTGAYGGANEATIHVDCVFSGPELEADGARSRSRERVRPWLAPVGETMFPPRAPSSRGLLTGEPPGSPRPLPAHRPKVPVSYEPPPERDYRPIHPEPLWRSLARRIWAPIAVAVGLVAKFGFAFAKFASVFVAVGGYALIWGWKFAVGFVLLIFVHEMGHFIEARRRGFNAAWPVFIPFLGAYVAIRDARMGPWQSAWISLAGPITGGLGAAICWVYGEQQNSALLQALGYVGFLLNLFNLLPVGILDGGSIWRAIKTMRLGGTPGKANTILVVYLGLAALLLLGMVGAHVPQHRL